jgi:hypothetical protein
MCRMENVKLVIYIIIASDINKNKQYPFSLMYIEKEL